MDFVEIIEGIPLTRSARQQLRRYAKALGLKEEAAAGRAIENYLADVAALELRLAAARAAAIEKP